MKAGDFMEKRKAKRFNLALPITVKHITEDGKEKVLSCQTGNVSYGGVYIVEINIKDIKVNDSLQISLTVPREEARDFPFSRLAGNVRVARVQKDGIGVEFNEDVSRLFIAN
jgi:hypothetical protein